MINLDPKNLFIVLFCLLPGLLLGQTVEKTEAQKCFETALELYEAAQYSNSRNKLSEAARLFQETKQWPMQVRSQNLIARNFIREGQILEAQKVLEQVANTYLDKVPTEHFAQGEWNMIMGEVYLNKGRPDRANQLFQKALQSYNRFHQKEYAAISKCYNLLALNYLNTGNWDLALEHQLQTLRICEANFEKDHPEIAAAYNDMGLVYSGQGNLDESLNYYEKALQIYQKIYPENHPKIANTYTNIAIIDQREGRYPLALLNFEQALNIWKNIYGLNHPRIAFAYASIGQVYMNLKDYTQAMNYQKDALNIYRSAYQEQHPEMATTYNAIANIYAAQKKYSKALDNYQQAIQANSPTFEAKDIYQNPRLENYYNADILLNTLVFKARSLEALHREKSLKRQDLESALSTLELCDQLIRRIRRLRINKSDKIKLGQTAKEVYEDAIRICITLAEGTLKTQYFLEKAFYFAEQSKSAVLLAAISDTDAKAYAKIPSNLLNQERYLKSEIAYYEQKIAEAPSPQEEKKLRTQLFNLNRDYENFIQDLENEFQDYYYLKYYVDPTEASEIQSLLGKNGQMISYFIAERNQRLYVFSLDSERIRVRDIPLDPKFEKYMIGLRNALQFRAKRTFLESVDFLARQLAIRSVKPKTRNLIVIPDGKIGTIPFEVLFTQKPDIENSDYKSLPYLIQQCAVSYSYSASLYYQLQNRRQKEKQENQGIFLCAPVVFPLSALETLPATEQEVAQLEALFKEKSLATQVFLRQEAQEMVIKSNLMKSYRFVHFATHGQVNENQPELSQLFLYGDSLSSDDGNLYTSEIYNLEMNADLVTLSACQTGLGKISQGEGIIGLSRALFYAGAQNVQVSLWKVADESTAELMRLFYQNILDQSDNFAQSLRQAKLQLIQQASYAAPYYWAPFILIGH